MLISYGWNIEKMLINDGWNVEEMSMHRAEGSCDCEGSKGEANGWNFQGYNKAGVSATSQNNFSEKFEN